MFSLTDNTYNIEPPELVIWLNFKSISIIYTVGEYIIIIWFLALSPCLSYIMLLLIFNCCSYVSE